MLSFLPASITAASEWPQFLGPHRNGLSAETGLIDSFPLAGPTVHWRCPGGVGMSGIAIADGVAYTLIQTDGRQWAIALDAETGDERWRAPLADAYQNSMGDGPRATPCVDGESLFTYTGEGILTALSTEDGSVHWSRHPVRDLGGMPADYGMACSPLVHEGRVIVTVGAPQATVAAFDVESGEPAWTAGSGDTAGYSSPTLMTINDQLQLVVFTGSSVLGIDPVVGDALWRHPWKTDYNCNIAIPLSVNHGVFISCGENHGSALLDVGPDGAVRERWTSTGTSSVLRNEWQTSLLVDGALYGFDNVGSAGPVTHFACIDPATGARRWDRKRFGKGNAIAADGKLWCSTMDGEIVLLKADPNGFRELGRAQVLDSTRQAPSLAYGRLYLRDGAEIVCLDVRRQ